MFEYQRTEFCGGDITNFDLLPSSEIHLLVWIQGTVELVGISIAFSYYRLRCFLFSGYRLSLQTPELSVDVF